MSSEPPYGNYPPQNQPWPQQPQEGSYPGYEQQASAYPPPPQYGATPYPPQQGQPPMPPMYGAPQIYVQPAAYPYAVAAPAEPGSGQAVTSLILGIVGTVFGLMAWIFCLAFIPIILGIVGFIMGILGLKSKSRHGMAVAGLILSTIAVALPVIFIVLLVIFNAALFAVPSTTP